MAVGSLGYDMEPNIGQLELHVRLVVGLLLIGLSMLVVGFGDLLGDVQGWLILLTLGVGTVILITVGVQRCPLNGLLGRNPTRLVREE